MNEPASKGSLQHVPITIFAAAMGTTGLGLAWRKAAETLNAPEIIGEIILAASIAVLSAALFLYALKAARHFQAVKAEFNHPVRAAFFSTLPISLLLSASALSPYNVAGAKWIWAFASALQLALTIRMLARWMVHKQDIMTANPGWFIPIVGNIIVPILGVKFQMMETAWFFWSVGMVFWLPMLAVILYRLMFHDQLPPKLMPTLFILLPPPAIGYLSYLGLTGEIDVFAQLLVNSALFLCLVLIAKSKRFLGLPFAMSWWAFTFPLDACALAFLEHARHVPPGLWTAASVAALSAATVSVALVAIKTTSALKAGALFQPE